MLNISFNVLRNNYPRKQDIERPALFKEIGWDDLIDNDAYENTCAIRVSMALIKCGVTIPEGRMAIKNGPHKGKMLEPG
jgi:hypothetical protein